MLNLLFYEITKFVLRSFLRSLLSCLPHFGNAAILVKNVLRTIRIFDFSKNSLSLTWRRFDSRRKISVKLPIGFHKFVDNTLVFSFFPSTWANIGLKCKRNSQSLGENYSFCADDIWSALKQGCKNKKKVQLPLLFFEPSNSVEDDFSGRKDHVLSQNDRFSNLKVFESEKVPSRKLWQRGENVLKIQLRAIFSTLLYLKCISPLLRRCSRSIFFLLHSTTSLQKTGWKIWGKKVSLFVDFFLIPSTQFDLWAKKL